MKLTQLPTPSPKPNSDKDLQTPSSHTDVRYIRLSMNYQMDFEPLNNFHTPIATCKILRKHLP